MPGRISCQHLNPTSSQAIVPRINLLFVATSILMTHPSPLSRGERTVGCNVSKARNYLAKSSVDSSSSPMGTAGHNLEFGLISHPGVPLCRRVRFLEHDVPAAGYL